MVVAGKSEVCLCHRYQCQTFWIESVHAWIALKMFTLGLVNFGLFTNVDWELWSIWYHTTGTTLKCFLLAVTSVW